MGASMGSFCTCWRRPVSKIPQGILSSCANLFVFQTRDAKVPISAWEGPRHDEVPHLGKSEKGMVNTEYKRYLVRIPKTYAMHKQPVVKLGYSADVYNMVPIAAWRSAAAGKSLSRPV